MRTTIDIPDPMLRQVKAKCALEGRTMRSLTLLFFQDWLGDGPSTAALLAAEGTGAGASAPVPADSRKKVRVRDLPMIGMWKDRDDMSDPAAFVRGLRKPRFAT
jgi:hypothetical protein